MAMNLLTKSCSAKRRYPTRPEAERALKYGHTWRPRPGDRAASYRCYLCDGWHVTSHRRRR